MSKIYLVEHDDTLAFFGNGVLQLGSNDFESTLLSVFIFLGSFETVTVLAGCSPENGI